jgi:hypothetical protein
VATGSVEKGKSVERPLEMMKLLKIYATKCKKITQKVTQGYYK